MPSDLESAIESIAGHISWDLAIATVTVVASAVAVLVFVASTGPGSRFLIRRVLGTARRRTVTRVITRHAVAKRRSAQAAARKMTNNLIDGHEHQANNELEWLATLRGDGLPISFVNADDESSRRLLADLAEAYEHMAGRWRARLVLGTRASELVASMASVAQDVSVILRVHSSNVPLRDTVDDSIEIDLRARGHFAQVLYTSRNLDLAVSPHPERLESVPGAFAGGGAQPRFEGILPHLLGEQLELDSESGRHRLHLAIGEMPYSQLLARNTPWDIAQRPSSSRTHAISLSLLPVTSDGYVLLAGRSDSAGSYPGMIGPYVTGNAELRDRHGLRADRDSTGLPDLLGAICREAREEVGLSLTPDQLRVIGLARTWSPEDTAIWCLITTAALTITMKEAAELVRFGDHVEGAWEVGSELFGVDPWRTENASRDVLSWAASADVVPQGVASLVALMSKAGSFTPIDWSDAATSPTMLEEPILQRLPLRHPFR